MRAEKAEVVEEVEEESGGDDGGGEEEERDGHGVGHGQLSEDNVLREHTQGLDEHGLFLPLLGEVGEEREVAQKTREHGQPGHSQERAFVAGHEVPCVEHDLRHLKQEEWGVGCAGEAGGEGVPLLRYLGRRVLAVWGLGKKAIGFGGFVVVIERKRIIGKGRGETKAIVIIAITVVEAEAEAEAEARAEAEAVARRRRRKHRKRRALCCH